MTHLLDKLTSSQLLTLIVVLGILATITITSVAASFAKALGKRRSQKYDYLDKPLYGGAPVAQRTEQLATDQQAEGSSPSGRTKEDA